MGRIRASLIAMMLAFAGASHSGAQDLLPDGTAAARNAMAAVRVPEGMHFDLFAAEPAVASPVAISIDEHGRVFVAEQYRFMRGCEENRRRDFLLEGDLQISSVEERLELFRKFADRFEGGMDWFTRVSDQVRILEDRDGDGRADFSNVFAPGFNHPAAGMAAGILAFDGRIYFTCIPHLWLLQDTDGDGETDVREVLHYGFGVNLSYLGHDLHGLIFGPDGRLYFSVGDRGYNVTTHEGRQLVGPRQGAVFRCEPDGSRLEVVHVGFRNPQELAFDEYGNLFTADNNADRGDLSRLIYVVEGGHSGWNMAYQSLTDPYLLGPWHAEKMWHMDAPEQPAWMLPPAGYLGAGPSGLTYYPGTGFGSQFEGCFFLANWTGNGGIETLRVEPQGAGFRLVEYADFLKPIRTSDVEFGFNGTMYVSDFPALNWETGESAGGRIYTLTDPASQTETVQEAERLVRHGFDRLTTDELIRLLDHPDMRVRLRAQYAAAERNALEPVTALALSDEASPRVRRHAVWALWQIARRDDAARPPLRKLLTVARGDVREQALRVLADLGDPPSAEQFARLPEDPSPRVQFFAAMALAKTDDKTAIPAVVRMLKQNANRDAYLRHAGVQALHSLCDEDAILELADSDDASVRLAALLVLRLRQSPDMARFLADDELPIVTEAARAINDLPIESAIPELAAVADRLLNAESGIDLQATAVHTSRAAEPELAAVDHAPVSDKAGITVPDSKDAEYPDALVRRVINANFRLGEARNAEAVLRLATSNRLNDAMRREALACLTDWAEPPARDRVTGFWRPLEPRSRETIRTVIQTHSEELLARCEGSLLTPAIQLMARYDVPIDDSRITEWARDPQKMLDTRIEALRLLVRRKVPDAGEILDAFLGSTQPDLRAAARAELARIDPGAAVHSIRESLQNERTTAPELQSGLQVLASLKSPEADDLIATLLNWYVDPPSPPPPGWKHSRSVELDVVVAAESRKSGKIAELLETYSRRLQDARSHDRLAEHRSTLFGGDAARGERVFRIHRYAQCMRCHKADGVGGDAGPDLSHVAARADREHILESLIEPDAKIAKGFGTVTLLTDDGRVFTGVVEEEGDAHVVVKTPEGRTISLGRDEIEERIAARSPMPSFRSLSKRDLRDLIEYLSTQK